ncbi:hypothetical protein M3Y94_00162100 [Aphelenchoides besseyi]|nr:hypothetical protein M3Y94_00162100 [Aphelenchoides besseyi]KAI6237056.1 hypothetical protein M3Y95_00224900 [Aphelenchoides besseyi]
MEGETAVVPMRVFANWNASNNQRASNYSMPRALSMILNKLTFHKQLETENSINISVRLQGHKRTLRSNDINVRSFGPGVQIPLDISFIIQYSHFVKQKHNILEILIQRRKKYKNRQIFGYKTLCAGFLNLDEVLQMGSGREIKIFQTNNLDKIEADFNDSHIATLSLSHCQTVAVQQPVKSSNKGTVGKDVITREDSEDNAEVEDESSDDSEEDGDFERTPRRTNSMRKRRSEKKFSQKNIKQKVANLLKRFKQSEEGHVAGNTDSSSTILPPTAKELQEIFQELENISDSGPEVDIDKLSIRSNPRPGLHRPYFGSKADILPIIDDNIVTDETDSEESSDGENGGQIGKCGRRKVSSDTPQSLAPFTTVCTPMKTSATVDSVEIPPLEIRRVDEPPSLAEVLTRLDSETSIIASNVWICSSADFPWISRVDFNQLNKVRIIDCPNPTEMRVVVQNVISRIQKFCNSNSVAPSPTLIGVYGTDRHVSHLLRAYVDLLRNKPAQNWISYLRFAIVCPPASALGRLLSQASDTGHIEASWRQLAKTASLIESGEATALDLRGFEDTLYNAINAAANSVDSRLLNLPIGEVMLQLNVNLNDSIPQNSIGIGTSSAGDGSQLFVPFLSELHLGNLDALNYLYFMKNSTEDPQGPQTSTSSLHNTPNAHANPQTPPVPTSVTSQGSTTSPPSSPQLPKTNESGRELHLEYWTYLPTSQSQPVAQQPNDFYDPVGVAFPTTPGRSPAPIGNKFSIKASLKTLSIARECTSNLLSIQFVKEKRKDKVLQKFGRRAKSKPGEGFIYSQARVVANVSRLICSGSKNSELEVSIDGVVWQHVRFFQVTSQWQTHVKLFPICVASAPNSGR